MKKLLSLAFVFLLTIALSATVFAVSADEGISFDGNMFCKVRDDLAGQPFTVEATLYFNKRATGDREGAYFGNYRHQDDSSGAYFAIDGSGHPKVYWSDGSSLAINSHTFKKVNVVKSEWVHLTIVMDNDKKEARCYINGELCETQIMDTAFDVWLNDFAVGGDMAILNPNEFKGSMKSIAVYSDVRTESEIKSDMKKVGTSDLILHYDFSDFSGEIPTVIDDLSKYKNDADLGRIWIDSPAEPVTDYAYSFIAIGDTQNMTKNYTEHYYDIYNWIYDNIESKNIEMVLGLGDITDQNYDYEWAAAAKAFDIIDGYVPHIPIRGNHDNAFWYQSTVSKLEYANMVDGSYGNDLRNTYVEMDIGGIPYLFLQLDFYLDEKIVAWADGVVEQYPNHNVIVCRHNHMWSNGAPLYREDKLAGIIGKDLWDTFLSQHENIVLVLSGHISSDHVLASQRKGVHGNVVTEMLIDFQSVDNASHNYGYSTDAGTGMVVILHFSEDGRKMTVETYSTVLDKYFYDYNQYTVELDIVSDTKYVKPEKTPIPLRSEKKTEIKMTLDSLASTVNGEAKTLDAAPVIKNNRTMLPVRFVAENLGATVLWDAATQTVTVKSIEVTIEIVIGQKFAEVNGQGVLLDSPAYIETSNNRTYLPVRVVAENLGTTVSWDDATKTATLIK